MNAMIFKAFYEDVGKMKAAARANGWTGDDGPLDYADGNDYHTGKVFPDKDAAIAWVQQEINAGKTVFGAGEVIEIQQVQRKDRCRYCTCHGARQEHRYIVTDEGIEHDEAIDDCYGLESP